MKTSPIDEANRWQNLFTFTQVMSLYTEGYSTLSCTQQRPCFETYRRLCALTLLVFDGFIHYSQLQHSDTVYHYILLLLMSILLLPVGYLCWELVLRLPRAPEGSSAMWQQQDIQGGMLCCKVQSLVDAWQLACSTVMLLRLDTTTTTAHILLLYPPTAQMQKQRKSQEPCYCFCYENVFIN